MGVVPRHAGASFIQSNGLAKEHILVGSVSRGHVGLLDGQLLSCKVSSDLCSLSSNVWLRCVNRPACFLNVGLSGS